MRIEILKKIVIFMFLVLLCRLFYIQIIKSKMLTELAERIYKKSTIISSERGNIYDRRGRILAITVKVKSLYANPRLIKDKHKLSKILAPILNIPQKDILSKFKKQNTYFVWLKRKLTKEELSKVNLLNIKGLGLIDEYKRIYPTKIAASVLGFVNIDNKGIEGLELMYDKYLRGRDTKLVLLRDAHNNLIQSKIDMGLHQGYDIILTIDEFIQAVAEEELAKTCQKYNADSGSVVILNPQTGEVLALAAYPTYDPNKFWEYKPQYFRCKAITDIYEVGSIFKIIPAAYLLENKLINKDSYFQCDGSIKIGNKVIRCHEEKHNRVNLADIMRYSCNIGMIKATRKISPNKFYNFINKWGFLEKANIDLYGQAKAIFPHPKYWSQLTLPNLVIGHGIAISNLHIALAYSSIIAEGKLLKPYILKAVIDKSQRIIYENHPKIIGAVLKRETTEAINNMLEKVVESGTGVNAKLANFTVAGKTGTAQKIDKKTKKYSKTEYIASFIGHLPSRTTPQLLISVAVDGPKGGIYWGGSVAAPLFKEISSQIINYLDIKPDSLIYKSLNNKKIFYQRDFCQGNKIDKLPNFIDLTMREAKKLLTLCNIKSYDLIGSGIVTKQFPSPEVDIRQVKKVTLWLNESIQ